MSQTKAQLIEGLNINTSAPADALAIDSSGKVGIGSTSPEFKLMVADAGYSAVEIKSDRTSASDNIGGLHFKTVSTSVAYIQSLVDGTLKFRNTSSLTERMRIDTSGRLLVGTSSSRVVGSARKVQIEGTSDASAGVSLVRNSNDSNSPTINIGKSRGTSAGSNTIVQSNDGLGSIYFRGADGTDLNTIGAAIEAAVDGTPGSNDLPGRLVFSTTADGASSTTERMRIDSSGRVGIATTPEAWSGFDALEVNEASIVSSGSGDAFFTANAYYDGAWKYKDAGVARNIYMNSDGIVFRQAASGSADASLTWSESMRIDSSGRLLIGTTAGATGRSIHANASGSGAAYFHSTNDNSGTGQSDGVVMGMGDATNAYFWNYESGSVVLATSGSSRLTIDSAGRVMIGTQTAGVADADQLTVASGSSTGITIRGSTSGNGNVFFSDTTSGTGQYDGFIQYQHASQNLKFGTGASEKMRIDSSGNVGIGETSADTRLHIKESTTGATGIFIQNSNGATNSSADLFFGNWNGSSTTTPQARIQAINTNVNSASTDLVFWTYSGSSTVERMRIDSDGDIHHTGVTSSGGSNKRSRYLVPSHSGTEEDVVVFQVENESSLNQITIGGGTASYNAATNIVFRTAAAVDTTTGEYRGRIDSNGDFLLQTTSNTQYGATSGAGSWGYTADTGTNRGSVVHANNADNGWAMMYMNKFNWTSGDDGRYINFYKNGGSLSSIMLNTSGTISYNTGSDYRLKENIVPMTNGITRVKQLLPKQFNMIDDPDDNLCDGFLAHEAQTVVPQAVWGTHDGMRTDEDGNEVPDYQGMDYGKLTPLLTAALQEAIAKIETLETQNADLLARVTALEAG